MAAPSILSILDVFVPSNPRTARLRFKMRLLLNCAFVGAVFLPCAFLFYYIPFGWLLDLALIGILYFMFFHVWWDRVIWIRCNHCGRPVATNTPWKCATCRRANRATVSFPFVHKCENCGAEPKAYRCHHKDCKQVIFLTKDSQAENCAVCLDAENSKEPEPEPTTQENEKRNKMHKILMAQLDLKYDALRRGPSGPATKLGLKRESVRAHSENFMAVRQAAKEQKEENAKTFAGDEIALKAANLAVDDWARKELDEQE